MKVAVTHDLSMDERIAIGVAMTGTFAPASRKDASAYIESAVTADLAGATALVKDSRIELARQIKATLATVDTVKEPTTS